MIRRAAGAAWLALAAAACGHAIFVPPSSPGLATDATSPWAAATSTCRAAQSYTAWLRVSGRAGPQRISSLLVETAVTADRIYMGATVSGRSIFVLAGSASQATLWLQYRENRVVKAPAGEIIEAILGLSMPPDRLLALLSGCVTRTYNVKSAESHDGLLAVQTDDARVFLQQQDAVWRTHAGEAEGFVVELAWNGGQMPARLWLNSVPGREPRASVTISVDDAVLNQPAPASVFAPPPGAASADAMTIEELRAAGPWRKQD